MTYCISCGSTLNIDSSICDACGERVSIATKHGIDFKERSYVPWLIVYILSVSAPSLFLGFIVTSSINLFNLLLLISIVTRIPYGFYVFVNFKDFGSLSVQTHGKSSISPLLMAVVFVIIPYLAIIPLIYKTILLNSHLRNEHQKETVFPLNNVIVSIIYLIPLANTFLINFLVIIFQISIQVISIVSLITFFVSLILFITAEFKWQSALNNHIRNHIRYLD